MAQKYSIGNKFDLVEEIAFEPIGCYYKAISIDGEIKLVLLLNSACSNQARARIEDFSQFTSIWNNYRPGEHCLHPIEAVRDFVEGVAIIMPYFDGVILAEYINNTKPHSLNDAKRLLMPLIVSLNDLHQSERFHGLINFSTTWVVKNKIIVIGFDVFSLIFNDFDIKDTGLENTRISSCISSELIPDVFKCSIYSDYYSILIIICSLLQGYILTSHRLNNDVIKKNLDKKSRVYLTKTFCDKSYNEFISLKEWIDKLRPATFSFKTHAIPLVTVSIFFSLIIYDYLTSEYAGVRPIQRANESTYQDNLSALPNIDKVASNLNSIKRLSQQKNKSQLTESESKKKIDAEQVRSSSTNDVSFSQNENIYSNIEKLLALKLNDIHSKSIKQIQQRFADEFASSKESTDRLVSTLKPGLQCYDSECYEYLPNGAMGPKLAYTNIENKSSYIMKQPVSNYDYYAVCTINSNCDSESLFKPEQISQCISKQICTDALKNWLALPKVFNSSIDVQEYINRLNKITRGDYGLVPDFYWSKLAQDLSPEKECMLSGDRTLSLYENYPELVKINSNWALRGPVKLLSDKNQCVMKLGIQTSDVYTGGVYARLVKLRGDQGTASNSRVKPIIEKVSG